MRTSFAPDAVARIILAIAAVITVLALARTAFGDAAWPPWDDGPLDGDTALGILRTWIAVAGALGIAVVVVADLGRGRGAPLR